MIIFINDEHDQSFVMNWIVIERHIYRLLTELTRVGRLSENKRKKLERSDVAFLLVFLSVTGCIDEKVYGTGHARMLIGEPNAEQLAQEIVARDLNVREVEAMARARSNKNGKKQTNGKHAHGAAAKDADTLAAEKRLADALGLTVSVDQRCGGGGTLSIRYRNFDQLDEVMRRLEKRL